MIYTPKGGFFDLPRGCPPPVFGVEFLKNGTEIKKSPRWRKLYCNKLQNDTPYDPVEVLSKAVGGGANRFLRFLQSSRCITRESVKV